MSSESNASTEFSELLRDTVEYLRFLKTFGVTHLGGAIHPIPTAEGGSQKSEVRSQKSVLPAETRNPEPELVEPETRNPEPVLIKPPAPPVQAVSETSPEGESPAPPAPKPMPTPSVIKLIKLPSQVPAKAAAPPTSLFDLAEPEPPPVVVPPTFHDSTLEDIRHDLGDCTRCKLCQGRNKIVFGDGNPNADLVFVGEAPGADEDRTGVPFVGRAGELLNKIIEAINLKREQVYICNVVKCRPPENRTPERDEIDTCKGFLFRQLALVKPKIIVALGAPAAFTLLGDNRIGSITAIRGNVYDYHRIPLLVTFHPAYLLRVPAKKREVWEDMKVVRGYLRGEVRIE